MNPLERFVARGQAAQAAVDKAIADATGRLSPAQIAALRLLEEAPLKGYTLKRRGVRVTTLNALRARALVEWVSDGAGMAYALTAAGRRALGAS